MKDRVLAPLLALVTLLFVGCAQAPPGAPDPVSSAILTGTWSGDVTESYGGAGRLRLVLEQVEFALTGTFRLEFDDAARNRVGTVSGNVETATLPARMQLSSSQGIACDSDGSDESFLQVSWTETDGRLMGTYAGFACIGTITGTFDVRRE